MGQSVKDKYMYMSEQIDILNRAVLKFGTKKKVCEEIGIYPQHFIRYFSGKRYLPLQKFLHLKNILD